MAQQKKVCITIDDLPAITNGISEAGIRARITDGLTNTLSAYDAHAIGYVNEGKLYQDGVLDSTRIDLLAQWLQNGQELGNHTFRHPSYHRTNFNEYTQDILRGERIIKELAKANNSEIKYFRHPYLHIGLDSAKASDLKAFLQKHEYVESPVTIDTDDYLFAAAYGKAYKSNDSDLMNRIADDYLNYMEEKIIFYEQMSELLYDRVINQTLLIHANLLNSDYLDELLDIYQKHGYQFVSQTEVLEDPAYQQKVSFFGNYGISWIKRWALSDGEDYAIFKNDPEVPDYIK